MTNVKRLSTYLIIAVLLFSGCYSWKAVQPSSTVVTPPVPATRPAVIEKHDINRFANMHPRSLDSRVTVLMFHDVVKERGSGSVFFDATLQEFNEILAYFEAEDATYLSLEDLHEHLAAGKPIPERAVVFTFDDNYQGFYDNAWPILREKKIPSGMFVHTDFIGSKTGSHPKMDWAALKELDVSGLVTIGGHTCSHPLDLKSLPVDEQRRELTDSKNLLESKLGHSIPFLAYPVGSADAKTLKIAKDVGYTMAFTMRNGPAEESPGILEVHRTIQTKYVAAFELAKRHAADVPAAIEEVQINPAPVTLVTGTFDNVGLVMVTGGRPTSVRDPDGGRKSVGEYVGLHSGVAGMNGTFFVNASLRGTDNAMIGPFQSQNEGVFYNDLDPNRRDKLSGRPFIVWNEDKIIAAPFNSEALNTQEGVEILLPMYTNCFLSGAWIVHRGVARKTSEMETTAARDFNDPRKRAFFGWKADGTIVYGATENVVRTSAMARGAAAAGLQEAFLMDSGFSTSIVYDKKILATGHTAESIPSRPVPHALVILGELSKTIDGLSQKAMDNAKSATITPSQAESNTEDEQPKRKKRRTRRRS